MKSADPTEWANRRKAAVERAKQIREERKNVLHDGDTFAPTINPKRSTAAPPVGANGNNSFKGGAVDSLDRLVEVARPASNDIMEMPLPAQRNKNQSLINDLPPSPNSDALGKELKRFGGPAAAQNSRAPPRPSASITSNSNSEKYKSQFLRQYEDERNNQHNNNNNNNNNQSSPAVDADETFSSMLRNDGNGDVGPGWNDDTTFKGFGKVTRRRSVNAKPKTENDKKPETTARSSAFRAAPPNMERGQSDFVEGRRAMGGFERNVSPRANSFSSYSDAPLNGNSRFVEDDGIENRGNSVRPSPRANELAMAKPALSLLKNKIRQSESSGSNSRSFYNNKSTGAGLTLNNNEDLQPSIGRRTAPDNLENSYQFNPAREQRRGGYGNGINGIADAPAQPSYSKRRDDDEEEAVEVIVPARRSRTQPQPQPVEDVHEANSNSYYNSRQQPANQSSMTRSTQSNRNYNVVEEAAVPTRSSRNNMVRNVVEEAAIPAQQSRNAGSKGFGNPQPPSQSYGKYPSQESDDDNQYDHEGFAQDSADEGQGMDGGELQQCPHCERRFNPIAFSKHVRICEKVFLKKRKVFDSTKMRVKDDPELLKLNMKAKKEEAKKAKQAAVAPMNDQRPIQPAENGGGLPKWKAQSSAFRQAMQAMREYNKAKAAGEPLPPPVATAPDPSLIPCPHCGRRFNEKAAERHIPKCQSIVAKPSALRKGAGGATSSLKAKR